MGKNWHALLFLICLSMTISACQSRLFVPTATMDSNLYTIDPVFRAFYRLLGGAETLGDVISDVQDINGIKIQYTVNGQLIFDPMAGQASRFQLGALGKSLGVGWSGQEPTEVAAPFIDLYDRLGGEIFIGKPITGLVLNESKNRYEQYFENLGFYYGEETGGVAHLLPYGAWTCGSDCRKPELLNNIPQMPSPTHANDQPTVSESTSSSSELSLQVWTTYPMLAAGTPQEVGVSLQKNDQPVSGVVLELFVTQPDGNELLFLLPPTNQDGLARLEVPGVQASNGSVIPYKVCLSTEMARKYCIRDSYLIWSNP